MNELKRYLNFLKLIGYDEIRVKRGGEPMDEEKKRVNSTEELERLKEEVLKCCKCRLCKTRTNVVFGEGNPETNLMFVGEAPGEQEDLQGRPFVGRAGHLLTRFLNLYDVSRDKIYITNIVKCRPPHNRNPEPDEIKACHPYLKRQIELIKPSVIICLGAFATRTILNLPEKTPISRVRGKKQKLGDVVVVPTFHPAYLLRNRGGETEFQKDLELALRLSGFLK